MFLVVVLVAFGCSDSSNDSGESRNVGAADAGMNTNMGSDDMGRNGSTSGQTCADGVPISDCIELDLGAAKARHFRRGGGLVSSSVYFGSRVRRQMVFDC